MKKQMKKKIGLGIAMVLAILMLGGVVEAFSGAGSGTEQDPYIITNVYQLQEMYYDLYAWYELSNDIDASATINWNEGAGFLPIGNDPNKFKGYFDGKEHTITSLHINRPDTNGVGLFGWTDSGCEIKNVGLINADVVGGNEWIGGLVGYNRGGTITNCYSTGSVSSNWVCGGLVGYNRGGTITNCYSTGSVSSNWVCGGLVGHSYSDGTVTNCYSTGSVSGNYCVGGLVGYNWGTTITNCYSTGSINGDEHVGGLVGWQNGTVTNCYSTGNVSGNYWVGGLVGGNDGTVTNSYSTGDVSGSGNDVGGLVGYSEVTCDDCFWDIETSGQTTSAGGTGKTTAEMKQETTFIGWSFAYIWDIMEGLTYPDINPRIFSGKGMWIWKLWETENGDVTKIIQKLNSVNVNWVTIKLGDGDGFWTTPNLTSEKIDQFHDAGIKVFGWQYVYGDDPVGEANVANQILDTGVDGFIINAEGEYEGKQDNAITYLENIRIEHPDSSIAYSTFARADSHEEFPYKEFGRYCDVAMPQTYWKDRPTNPTNEVAEMHSQWSDLYESWEGTEYSSSIKPIIPMGHSYSDLHGYCSGSEIIEFCNVLYDYGYEKTSIWRYDIMTDETRDAYTISFNEVLIVALSPVDLVVTDPDGLEISKELNEIPRATYLEYDINGDDELDDIVAIPKRKIGDYLTQVIPEPNVLPTDTYSLEVALEAATENQTMVIAEDVQVQDIPEDPYGFESKLCYSDFDGDVDVDFVDYAIFTSHWSEQDCNYPAWCEGTDLDYSGSVDFNDLAIFTEHWLWPESQTTEGQGGGMGGMGSSGSQQMEQQSEEPLDTQPVQQVQPVKKININKLVRFLEEIWLQDDGVREIISEDRWNEFIDSVKNSPAY